MNRNGSECQNGRAADMRQRNVERNISIGEEQSYEQYRQKERVHARDKTMRLCQNAFARKQPEESQ